jgi:hypothetical protein
MTAEEAWKEGQTPSMAMKTGSNKKKPLRDAYGRIMASSNVPGTALTNKATAAGPDDVVSEVEVVHEGSNSQSKKPDSGPETTKDEGTWNEEYDEKCVKAAEERCKKDPRCRPRMKERGSLEFFKQRCTGELYAAREAAREEHHKCMADPKCRARFFGATKRCMANKHCKARYEKRRAKYHDLREKREAKASAKESASDKESAAAKASDKELDKESASDKKL